MSDQRIPIDDALKTADGLLIVLFHARSEKSISDEVYGQIHDKSWAWFTADTGWTQDEIDNEMSNRYLAKGHHLLE
jgi:hypothetical protein